MSNSSTVATKLAVLGCAHIHMPDVVQVLGVRPEVRVAAVWDHAPARARRWAAELGAPATAELSSIWRDQQVQAVVVMSETAGHGPLVNGAATAGKAIFVEKPLATGATTARQMADVVRRASWCACADDKWGTTNGDGPYVFSLFTWPW